MRAFVVDAEVRMYSPWLILLALLFTATVAAQLPSDIELDVIVDSNAGLSGPVAVRSPNDGSGRLFVVEQGGTIKIFDTKGNALSQNFLTVSVTCCGEIPGKLTQTVGTRSARRPSESIP